MAWFPGENLIKKMWETLADKGIGNLLRPWQIRREGMANIEIRRAEILAIAQAEKQAEEIRAGGHPIPGVGQPAQLLPPGRHEEAQTTPALLPHNPAELALRATVADGVRREANVARAIMYAEQEFLGDETAPPDKAVEDDWLYRWRDYAAQVSAEQLQSLWGKLLAGEFKNPGHYSLRTLEFLRSLSSEEARAIEGLSPFVVNNYVIRSQLKTLEEAGVSFQMLLSLQEIGVVSGVEALGLNVTYASDVKDRFRMVLVSHKRALIVQHDDATKTLKLDVYAVTAVGRQILNLGTFVPNETYLQKIAEEIMAKGFTVEIADVLSRNEGAVRVQKRQKIEPPKSA